jgi:hypothetical protein
VIDVANTDGMRLKRKRHLADTIEYLADSIRLDARVGCLGVKLSGRAAGGLNKSEAANDRVLTRLG